MQPNTADTLEHADTLKRTDTLERANILKCINFPYSRRLQKRSADQCRHRRRLRLFNSIQRARKCTFLTPQRSTAVSINTRIVVARFPLGFLVSL